MKSRTDPRHAARRLALASIFCWLFSEQNKEECQILSKELLDHEEVDNKLSDFIIDGVKINLDNIDKIIENAAPEWPLDKISKVDLVVLRIAVFEIVYGKKAPIKVAIDESVELAKEFGNDTSHKFVNGVLGTIVDQLENKQ
ncbi:transcription antitermination factor NusB [candidate division WWE3 bacterium]|jgi:N utilization substance protein B|uniref:Transcription antitermination protein NusB n=1 Tax=candidate division WWE3 bacterium TaxID=2053526 RepID=A0A3A4ZLI3_UNCKA|nr:MAG: transcription antitermination factor NusB [candidate division WWE3 bacterium]